MRELQQHIIAELGVKPVIDPEYEINARTEFLAREIGGSGLKGFVLGISGGQDSLLAGILAQRAVEQVRERGGDAAFHAIMLPYGAQRDRSDVLLALQTIKPDYIYDHNIKPEVDAYVASRHRANGRPITDFNKGNVKARMRMIAQYDYASEHNGLVVGTDHAAEAVTGFFTKYGDGGADILPLAGLNKRQGRQLLGALAVPQVFIEKPPTADLLDHAPGQPDEHELGLNYDTVIDPYLEASAIDPADAERLEQQFLKTRHKRAMPTSYVDYERYLRHI